MFLVVAAAVHIRASVPPNNLNAKACEAAWVYIQSELARSDDRPIVFSTAPEQLFPSLPEGDWVDLATNRMTRDATPPADLKQKLVLAKPRSAIEECPRIREKLAKRGIAYGKRAVEWALNVRRGRPYKARIIRVSLPVVSHDGKEAALVQSGAFGPVSGGSSLYYLVVRKGVWQLVSTRGLLVA